MLSIKEKELESEIIKLGHRYKICDRTYPGSPDLFFPDKKVAIFFHGCFWHYHDCKIFKLTDIWEKKLQKQRQADKLNRDKLRTLGVTTHSVWECSWDKNKQKELDFISDLLFLAPTLLKH